MKTRTQNQVKLQYTSVSIFSPEQNSLLHPQEENCAIPSEVPATVHEALSSPGQTLDLDTRAYIEPFFWHEFGRIQLNFGNPKNSRSHSITRQIPKYRRLNPTQNRQQPSTTTNSTKSP